MHACAICSPTCSGTLCLYLVPGAYHRNKVHTSPRTVNSSPRKVNTSPRTQHRVSLLFAVHGPEPEWHQQFMVFEIIVFIGRDPQFLISVVGATADVSSVRQSIGKYELVYMI